MLWRFFYYENQTWLLTNESSGQRKKKTSCHVSARPFTSLRMLFKRKKTAEFQCSMEQTLPHVKYQIPLVYSDNIVKSFSRAEQHVAHQSCTSSVTPGDIYIKFEEMCVLLTKWTASGMSFPMTNWGLLRVEQTKLFTLNARQTWRGWNSSWLLYHFLMDYSQLCTYCCATKKAERKRATELHTTDNWGAYRAELLHIEFGIFTVLT